MRLLLGCLVLLNLATLLVEGEITRRTRLVETDARQATLAIAKAQDRRNVLQAEWAYLTTPTRLADLSKALLPNLTDRRAAVLPGVEGLAPANEPNAKIASTTAAAL